MPSPCAASRPYRHAACSIGFWIRFPRSDETAKKGGETMIRKLASGKYRLFSRKKDARTGKRRNLGTFATRAAAERHERAVQFFKRH